MQKLLNIVRNNFDLDNRLKSYELFEAFYAKKYGSKENAVIVFQAIQNSCINEKEFQILIDNKIKKDFHYDLLKKILDIFKQSKGLFSLIKNIRCFTKNIKGIDSVYTEILEIEKLYSSLAPEFNNIYGVSKEQLKNGNCSLNIEDYLCISLAQVRKECGYPDKRTFDKWLKTFFGNKYSNRGNNNGYISIDEYAEILNRFFLKPEEYNFPSDLIDLENRFRECKLPLIRTA